MYGIISNVALIFAKKKEKRETFFPMIVKNTRSVISTGLVVSAKQVKCCCVYFCFR